jgi:hypothetical protein
LNRIAIRCDKGLSSADSHVCGQRLGGLTASLIYQSMARVQPFGFLTAARAIFEHFDVWLV